ncbi:MAG: 50S ribosomal protein L6 [Phycisphaerae bacterium]|nr:50S ribosomal protein L6 [Phycisphaerae bacterium]
MSRIGMKPVPVPSGVNVSVSGATVQVEGSLGKLSFTHRPEVAVKVEGDQVVVTRRNDERQNRALHGLTRSLINNMVIGVSQGYQKKLEVYGVGYGVQLQGQNFTINCGKSHPEVLSVPAGVIVDVQTPQARGDSDPAKFTVKGPDKQAVGEFAAKCRRCRPPEPYKGKGVRYADEHVRRKVGKAFAGGGG